MKTPVARFQVGPCSASVFANEIQTPDGIVQRKNIVLQRTYRDKDGNFQNSSSFGINDVPKAMVALRKAYEHVVMERRGVPDKRMTEGGESELGRRV